jgi:hypothetical protein
VQDTIEVLSLGRVHRFCGNFEVACLPFDTLLTLYAFILFVHKARRSVSYK